MTTMTECADRVTQSAFVPVPMRSRVADPGAVPDLTLLEPLTVPAIAESAEAVIEEIDAPVAAAPALMDQQGRAGSGAAAADPGGFEDQPICVDEYAKAVLYNGLGHYHAARAAAERACQLEDFALLEGALSELVEAGVRSGSTACAATASQRLEARAQKSGSEWAMGLSACARALLTDDDRAEVEYVEAIERLGGTGTRVAEGRARLLYGEWLRRRGQRVDAREQLTLALGVFSEVGMGGFAERARREVLATCRTVRKRNDDTRLALTAQEARIAQLAAGGLTNPEIGERMYISKRTVEWHLRKVFTKLGVGSRRELTALDPRAAHIIGTA